MRIAYGSGLADVDFARGDTSADTVFQQVGLYCGASETDGAIHKDSSVNTIDVDDLGTSYDGGVGSGKLVGAAECVIINQFESGRQGLRDYRNVIVLSFLEIPACRGKGYRLDTVAHGSGRFAGIIAHGHLAGEFFGSISCNGHLLDKVASHVELDVTQHVLEREVGSGRIGHGYIEPVGKRSGYGFLPGRDAGRDDVGRDSRRSTVGIERIPGTGTRKGGGETGCSARSGSGGFDGGSAVKDGDLVGGQPLYLVAFGKDGFGGSLEGSGENDRGTFFSGGAHFLFLAGNECGSCKCSQDNDTFFHDCKQLKDERFF